MAVSSKLFSFFLLVTLFSSQIIDARESHFFSKGQKQGLSDSRFLDDGRFHYDVDNEWKNNYYPNQNQYQNSREVVSRNNENNTRGNYYGNNNEHNNYSMDGNQNQGEQYEFDELKD